MIPDDNVPVMSICEDPPPKKKLKGVLSEIMGEQVNCADVALTPVNSEIASYLNFPVVSVEIDPLKMVETRRREV
jgi:hypothetical protein